MTRFGVNLRTLMAPAFALAVAAALLALPAPAQVLPGGNDCVYDPDVSCCQCIYNTPTCYETEETGGVKYCSDQVCPLSGSARCCEGGVECP